jgi:hypothetical protein
VEIENSWSCSSSILDIKSQKPFTFPSWETPSVWKHKSLTPSKSAPLEGSPTSEEDDNRGGHPNTGETTSLDRAPTSSHPHTGTMGEKTQPLHSKEWPHRLGEGSHAKKEAYRPRHEKMQVPEKSEDLEMKEGHLHLSASENTSTASWILMGK